MSLVGCGGGGHDHDHDHAHGHDHSGAGHAEVGAVTEGIVFKNNSGLLVRKETIESIGLKMADVTERKVAGELRFTAQVYRKSGEGQPALASAVVGQREAALLKPGLSIAVKTDGAEPFMASVVSNQAGTGNAGDQAEVLLSVPDPARRLATGSFLSAAISIGSGKPVLSVPLASLLRTMEGDFVYVLNGDALLRTPVRLGAMDAEFAEVTDGLLEGDIIAVSAVATLWLAEIRAVKGGDTHTH